MLNRIFTAAAITLISMAAYAQPVATPPAYPNAATAPVNYIRTWDVSAPVATEADLLSRPLRDVKQATQYIDGLGRPLQTVLRQGSMATGAAAADMVSPQVYDAYGREQYKYLPFAANGTGSNTSISDGGFKRNPFQQQAAFAAVQYPGETYYYSKTNFETSPLSTVLETYAPGNSWAGSESSTDITQRRNVSSDQVFNTSNDEVWIWTVTMGSGNTLSSYSCNLNDNYIAGQLVKTITKDEQGKQIIEYKDRDGHTILKKVQLTAAADDGSGSNMAGWLCTYYLYDDFGDLSCVIPPKAVQGMLDAANRTLTATMLTELCFRYEYDGRRRMTMKQVPGAGITNMVYDALDRLILTQDPNTAGTGKWLYTRYDALSRPVSTGSWNLTLDRASLQMSAYSSTNYPASVSGSAFEELTETHYGDADNFSPMYPYDNASFATASNTVYPYPQPLTQSKEVRGMVVYSYLKTIGATGEWDRFNYYDDYGRILGSFGYNEIRDLDILTNQYSYGGQLLQTITHEEKAPPAGQTHIVQSKLTYDDLGRVVKTEKKMSSDVHSVSTMSHDWTVIATQEYDAAGQLIKKNLGNKPGEPAGTPLAKINYEYNIRGWLLSLNKDYVTGGPNNDEYFGMSLGYDKTATGPNNTAGTLQYNGNINAEVWRSVGDGEKRKYDFTYDAMNRLIKADFKQNSGSAWDLSAGVDFSMKLGDGINASSAYDENGNIKAMTQTGLKINTSSIIDNMRYTYIAGTNKLKSVTDFANDPISGLGDFKTNTTHPQATAKAALTNTSPQTSFDAITDYTYDVNGNITADNNKNIQNIQYNYLNLPQLITIPGKGTIAYVYDAGGTKLRKTTTETGATVHYNGTDYTTDITTETTYINSFVYETKHYSDPTLQSSVLETANSLQFFGSEEGRVRINPQINDIDNNPIREASYGFDYFLKDHLGNVRSVVTEDQLTHHYSATMEDEARETEDQLFGNIDETAFPISQITPVGLPDCDRCIFGGGIILNDPPRALVYDDPDNTNENVSKLNGSGKKIGPTLTLKVMAGDKIDLGVKVWYPDRDAIASHEPPEDVLNSLVTTLSNNAAGISGAHASAGQLGSTGSPLVAGLVSFLASHPANNGDPSDPSAYINWVLFDENFKYVPEGSGFIKVGSFSDDLQELSQQGLQVNKSGYLFVYLSNETEHYDVFFDDLVVDHTPGPLMEETHYYPFGLVMAGISSKAAGPINNRYKFNGIEQENDFDLNYSQAFYRTIDPQIGRFLQIDPVTTHDESPYVMMGNNPIKNADWLGNYFTWGNEEAEDRYKRLRKSNNERLSANLKELATKDLNSNDRKVQNSISELNFEINFSISQNTQWDEMENSGVEFHVADGSTEAAAQTEYNSDKNRIDITMKYTGISDLAHELRHGYGYMIGELTGSRNGDDATYDQMDEAEAYHVSIFFGTHPDDVKRMAFGYYSLDCLPILKSKAYDYIKERHEQLTLNSPAASILNLTQDSWLKNYIQVNSSNANLTVRDAYNARNQHEINSGRPAVYIFGDALKNR